ncbi:MAG: dTMP kinase [Endomicrobium sp.]|jgi:dTMP kinase|nr:dTMP kinase [Endomicrobium sp.]
MPRKNIFITFEGIDGAGKTTQAKLLARYLQRIGCKVLLTMEPGGEALSDMIRNIIFTSSFKICSLSELFLYEAARAQHTMDIILPALKQGSIVICDRFIDSTIAYQGYGCKIDLELIQKLNSIASYQLLPTITLYLDIVPVIGLDREVIKRKKIKSILQFYNNVRTGYLIQAKKHSKRIHIIKSTSLRQIQIEIRFIINKILKYAQIKTKI